MSLLLEHEADPNLVDINGNTALHLAARIPSLPVALQLLEHSANINAQNKVKLQRSTPVLTTHKGVHSHKREECNLCGTRMEKEMLISVHCIVYSINAYSQHWLGQKWSNNLWQDAPKIIVLHIERFSSCNPVLRCFVVLIDRMATLH